MRVLLIEDDPITIKTVELALASAGIICDTAHLGNEGMEISQLYEYDLIILDLMLPDMDGYDVLMRLRSAHIKVPVFILSGLSGSEKKIKGLCRGADDYLTKPFTRGELVARIQAIVRRSKGHSNSILKFHKVKIDTDNCSVTVGDKAVHLTNKEYRILELLAMRKGSLLTKEMFLSHLYGGVAEPYLKTIDVFVCKLRKKLLAASGGINYIETIWGRGYTLKDFDEDKDSSVIDSNYKLENKLLEVANTEIEEPGT